MTSEIEVEFLPPPGEVLTKRREVLGWSRRDVSDQINLDEKVIAGIEEGDYENLPPATFVMGYIRSYARLMDIDSQPLIDAYQNKDAPAGTKDSSRSATPAEGEDEGAAWIQSLVIFIVFCVLAATIFWWYLNRPEVSDADAARDMTTTEAEQDTAAAIEEPALVESLDESSNDETSQAEPALDIADLKSDSEPEEGATLVETELAKATQSIEETLNEPVQEVEAVAEVLDESQLQSEAQDQTVSEQSSEPEQSSSDETEQVVTDARASDDTEVDSSDASETEDKEVIAEESNTEKEEAAPEPEPAAVSASEEGVEDILLISAGETSWVSIVDINGKRLMYGMLTSGTPRKMQGKAPFNVIVGLAETIKLNLNGEDVDFTQLIRRSKTARFIIDPDGSTRRR